MSGGGWKEDEGQGKARGMGRNQSRVYERNKTPVKTRPVCNETEEAEQHKQKEAKRRVKSQERSLAADPNACLNAFA